MDIKQCDFCKSFFGFSIRENAFIEIKENVGIKENQLNRFTVSRRSLFNTNEMIVDICDNCYNKLFNKEWRKNNE